MTNTWTSKGHRFIASLLPPLVLAAVVALLFGPVEALAHGVAAGDKGYLQNVTGILPIPFAYPGARHMVTGYDQDGLIRTERRSPPKHSARR